MKLKLLFIFAALILIDGFFVHAGQNIERIIASGGVTQNSISSRAIRIGNPLILNVAAGPTTSGVAPHIQNSNQQAGMEYYPASTQGIQGVDLFVTKVGAPTSSATYWIDIQTNSSSRNVPSGISIASTSPFSMPSLTGFTGLQKMVVSSTALTTNLPVWVVLNSTGTAGTGPNTVAYWNMSSYPISLAGAMLRQQNGDLSSSSWYASTSVNLDPAMVLQLNDGTFTGFAATSSFTNNTNGRVQSSTMAGLTFTFGVQTFLQGIGYNMRIVGNPTSSLTWTIYNGTTALASSSMASTTYNGAPNENYITYFNPPVTLPAGAQIYAVANNQSGSIANYYAVSTYLSNSAYVSAMEPPKWFMVYGTTTDPTNLTIDPTKMTTTTSELAVITPVIDDPSVDLVPGGSGGTVTNISQGWFAL